MQAARPTQVDRALAQFTPRTRRVVPEALLEARVGRRTLAGALNDQVRFRVAGTSGPVDGWRLVADSPTAAALVQSAAGPGLLRQLDTAMRTARGFEDVTHLKGFILPEDVESTVAARALAWLDSPGDPDAVPLAAAGRRGDSAAAGALVRAWRPELRAKLGRVGAWNTAGWITFSPNVARAMLVNAGAYAPDPVREPELFDAEARTAYLSGNGPHEVQHSVSPRPRSVDGPIRWMEEGIANVVGRTPVFQARNARAAGLTPEHYRAALAAGPSFDVGWQAYHRPRGVVGAEPAFPAEPSADPQRFYVRSQVVLRDLVRLAGADFRSGAGQARAKELLQRRSIGYVPGVLAHAIIERHGLDPEVYDRLRARIEGAVDLEGGVAALAREFGITAPH